MYILTILGAVVSLVAPPAAGLPQNDYCMGCMTTMEAMFLLARESRAVQKDLPAVTDIAVMLCNSQYFDVFNDFIKEGCRQMLQSDPDAFRAAVADILATDADLYNPHASKLAYFDFAKERCENKFNACSKGTFKTFYKHNDRSECVACQIVVDEMAAFSRAIPDSNATHILKTVCQSLAYKNQPGAWLEDACFEIVDDNNAALKTLFSGPNALELKDSAAICRRFDVGCPRKGTTKDL